MSTNNFHNNSDESSFTEIEKRLFYCKVGEIYENIHYILDKNSNALRCLKCNFEALSKVLLESHFQLTHLPSVPGSYVYCCRLVFLTEFDYLNHIRKYHQYGYFCWFCTKHMINKRNMEQHFISDHANQANAFIFAILNPCCKEFKQLAEAGHPCSIMAYQINCQNKYEAWLKSLKLE